MTGVPDAGFATILDPKPKTVRTRSSVITDPGSSADTNCPYYIAMVLVMTLLQRGNR